MNFDNADGQWTAGRCIGYHLPWEIKILLGKRAEPVGMMPKTAIDWRNPT